MPKLYEYLGIAVFFYSRDHDPIHVHGRKGGCESKIDLRFGSDGTLRLRVGRVTGKKPLTGPDLSDFEALVVHKAEEIVERWAAFYIRKERVQPQIITRRIRR